MGRVISPAPGEMRVPIHVWARRLPRGALEQLERLARQPYVVERLAAMPDVHVASGVCVGTVFATERFVVPGALGGDLGCGVSALRFHLPASELSREVLTRWLVALGRVIPVGDDVHPGRGREVPDALRETPLSTRALEHERERLVGRHLGTLGGGNHFVELDRDSTGAVWLLVHSGSRGLGAAIGAHHQRVAEILSRARGRLSQDDRPTATGASALPALATDTPEGQACLADLGWALQFARANREVLLERATQALVEQTGAQPYPDSHLDVHHNFVAREQHAGKWLWVHRKGAISADLGARALIPGSMGTASYVVEGLGEASSFRSASHGAGRVLTRREARERIRRDRFRATMRAVVFDPRREPTLVEEAPDAYRDIREVLDDEADLVRPVLRLEPLAVLKG